MLSATAACALVCLYACKENEYLKEFNGHYMSSNAFFDKALLDNSPGDEISVQVSSLRARCMFACCMWLVLCVVLV
jgi:hypothetical protein